MSFGVNVVGFVSGNFGLATAVRSTIAALVAAGVPVNAIDVNLGDGRAGFDLTWQHLLIGDVPRLPHPVTLVHVNPAEAQMLRTKFPHWFASTYNVIVPFYELPLVPTTWIATLRDYDLILAPTEHIAAAIRNIVPVPVRLHPMSCERVTPAPLPRERYSIPEDRFVFATSFDRGSGSQRKNAAAVIRAFELAFRDDDRAFLVVKVNGKPQGDSVDRLLSGVDPSRCRTLDGYLPYNEVLGLYNACDAFVSLHRAEGLGLGPMEAMLLGKPVIATGWSGNMDFMTDDNALLVSYAFTPVIDAHNEYSPTKFTQQVCWAEPDVAHAAVLMRRIVDNPELAARIGAHARASIERRADRFFSPATARTIEAAYEASMTPQQLVR
jgi:glycosyltransferase involved in cell wall biosynthesis